MKASVRDLCTCDGFCPHVVHIESPLVQFPLVGGGAVMVGPLAPGECERVTVNGHAYVVVRDAVQ